MFISFSYTYSNFNLIYFFAAQKIKIKNKITKLCYDCWWKIRSYTSRNFDNALNLYGCNFMLMHVIKSNFFVNELTRNKLICLALTTFWHNNFLDYFSIDTTVQFTNTNPRTHFIHIIIGNWQAVSTECQLHCASPIRINKIINTRTIRCCR